MIKNIKTKFFSTRIRKQNTKFHKKIKITKEFIKNNVKNILKRIKENPHPNIVKIFKYDDNYIYFEYIKNAKMIYNHIKRYNGLCYDYQKNHKYIDKHILQIKE